MKLTRPIILDIADTTMSADNSQVFLRERRWPGKVAMLVAGIFIGAGVVAVLDIALQLMPQEWWSWIAN